MRMLISRCVCAGLALQDPEEAEDEASLVATWGERVQVLLLLC